MSEKKNIILALGNKEFNSSLFEIKDHLDFNLEIDDKPVRESSLKKYQGLIIHEDFLKDINFKSILKDDSINKIIMHSSKKIHLKVNIDSLSLPTSVDQINKVVLDNIVKRKFKLNSSLKINDYILDKNTRKLFKKKLFLQLTEKEVELIELLYKKLFTKKKEILSTIWKYSNDADTHTVETHIYRLRKKINDKFKDEKFILNNKDGYYL